MLHLDAEMFHHVEREQNIRSRNQLPFNMDMQRRFRVRGTYQKRREILARDIAAHRHGSALKAMRIDADRRKTIRLHITDIGTKRTESIDQVTDWTLLHAFLAAQVEHATSQRKRRTQRTHRCSRIAQIKAGEIPAIFQQDRRGINRGAITFDNGLGKILGHFHMDTERLQGLAHVAGVVAFQEIVQAGRSFGKGRHQKHAVRDTFRSGNAKFTVIRLQSGNLYVTGAKKRCIHIHKFIN